MWAFHGAVSGTRWGASDSSNKSSQARCLTATARSLDSLRKRTLEIPILVRGKAFFHSLQHSWVPVKEWRCMGVMRDTWASRTTSKHRLWATSGSLSTPAWQWITRGNPAPCVRDKMASSPTACRTHCVQSRGGIDMSLVDKVNPDLAESYTMGVSQPLAHPAESPGRSPNQRPADAS